MNCSGKFFVPIVICGPGPVLPVEPPPPEPPPPQPDSSAMSISAASTAMARGRLISRGYARLLADRSRRCRRLRWQGEAERAALPGFALGPDPPAVLLDDPLADGEADAGARV